MCARCSKFVRDWDHAEPMLIHCFAGVSRSTAAAFIAACALTDARDEARHRPRAARRLADRHPQRPPRRARRRVLGRSGRMIAAIAAIGRGEDCETGVPFGLEIG